MQFLAVGGLVVLCLINSVKSVTDVEVTIENLAPDITYTGTAPSAGIYHITGGTKPGGSLTLSEILSTFSSHPTGKMNVAQTIRGTSNTTRSTVLYNSATPVPKTGSVQYVEVGYVTTSSKTHVM